MKKLIFVVLALAVALQASACRGGVTLCLTGDLLLDRGVRKQLDAQGAPYPYDRVKSILRGADIAFGNLECPLTDGGVPALKRIDLVFAADPANAKALRDAGYDILNLANNHSMDQSAQGLRDTVAALDEASIAPLGAGATREQARQPVYRRARGLTIGFLGYSDFPPEGYVASADGYSICGVDSALMGDEIRNARAGCDFLVVSLHFGVEFAHYPSENQKALARLCVDAGADLIVGHHPHVLQGIETYKGKTIAYSLGNFVFDKQVPPGTDESVILLAKIDKSGLVSLRTIPVVIRSCQPVPAQGDEKEAILKKLEQYSKIQN